MPTLNGDQFRLFNPGPRVKRGPRLEDYNDPLIDEIPPHHQGVVGDDPRLFESVQESGLLPGSRPRVKYYPPEHVDPRARRYYAGNIADKDLRRDPKSLGRA